MLALSAFAKGGSSIAIIGTILAINDVVKSGNNSGVSPIGSGINAVTNSNKGDVVVAFASITLSAASIVKNSFNAGAEIDKLGALGWTFGRCNDGVGVGNSVGSLKKKLIKSGK